MQGGSQAPLPKKLWAQLLLEPVPSLMCRSQLTREEGTPLATGMLLLPQTPTDCRGVRLESHSWGYRQFSAFLPYSQALLSLPSSLTVVSQPLLTSLFSRLVWNLGKSGIFLSNSQSSLILWRSCLQRCSISEVLKLWEFLSSCILII